MNKKACIIVSILAVLIAVAVAVTLVLVLRKHKKDENRVSMDDIISENSTFPDGSFQISADSLKSGMPAQAPLFINVSMLNDLGLRVDNSSLIAETGRLSYFFVRLPSDDYDNNTRVKRQAASSNVSVGIRFGTSTLINVVPLNLSDIANSGVTNIGSLPDNSQVYQFEIRMSDEMCTDASSGSCSVVQWTPYSISNGNLGSQAEFVNNLPVACGSQCDADATSACATSCSTCDGQQVAGADTPVTRRYKMGTKAGNVTFSFETYIVKDRITVWYEGQNLFDSKCIGTNGERQVPIYFKGKTDEIRVDVEPNCEGTTGTEWHFTLPCVDCKGCQEYQCLEYTANCGSKGYLIDFGLYYCNRFSARYNEFDANGQKFIDCVRPNLLSYVSDYLDKTNGNVDCADLEAKAFSSHVPIYTKCNFCQVHCVHGVSVSP